MPRIALAELSPAARSVRRADEQRGARLGLANTHFANATGCRARSIIRPPTTSRCLLPRSIRDFPEYYPLYALKEFRYNNITQANRNRLLWTDPYVDGMKTGHTEDAGWCLIASAKRGDRRLLSVVLGAASDAARASEGQKLLNYGFQAFDTVQLYQSGKPVSHLRVWKGARAGPAGFSPTLRDAAERQGAELQLTMEATEPWSRRSPGRSASAP